MFCTTTTNSPWTCGRYCLSTCVTHTLAAQGLCKSYFLSFTMSTHFPNPFCHVPSFFDRSTFTINVLCYRDVNIFIFLFSDLWAILHQSTMLIWLAHQHVLEWLLQLTGTRLKTDQALRRLRKSRCSTPSRCSTSKPFCYFCRSITNTGLIAECYKCSVHLYSTSAARTKILNSVMSVSYTHLTLPTIYSV